MSVMVSDVPPFVHGPTEPDSASAEPPDDAANVAAIRVVDPTDTAVVPAAPGFAVCSCTNVPATGPNAAPAALSVFSQLETRVVDSPSAIGHLLLLGRLLGLRLLPGGRHLTGRLHGQDEHLAVHRYLLSGLAGALLVAAVFRGAAVFFADCAASPATSSGTSWVTSCGGCWSSARAATSRFSGVAATMAASFCP